MSIKKSLRIALILSSMIPVILLTVIAYTLLTNKLITDNAIDLKRNAETNVSGLNSMMETLKTEVSLLAIQDELLEVASKSNTTGDVAADSINDLLQSRIDKNQSCKYISLCNAGRKIIASSNPAFIGTYNDNIKTSQPASILLSNLHTLTISGQTIYTIDIGSPILDSTNKEVIGYVISTIEPSYFNKFLSSISYTKNEYSILLEYDGTILCHSNSELVGGQFPSYQLCKIYENHSKGLADISGTFRYKYNNSNQVYGYCIIPELKWILLVKQNTSELKSVGSIMLPLLLIVCAAMLIIIYIFSNTLAKELSAPIISLRDAMRAASDGNLTVQSNIKSNNELGELSKNFNKMLHIIKTNYEDLESMHEELLSNEEQLRSNYDHIEFLAYHDTLTNLPNKLAFLDYVNNVLKSSQPDTSMHAVYFVDLDNFKTVNDTLGHEYGDALLVKTAQILTSILGTNSMLARAGGDEFLLFKESIASKKQAVDFASQIIDYFKNSIDLNGEIVYVSMSIGISIYPENGLFSNILIKNSDIAMYKSKDTGKNKFTLFNKKMEEELHRSTLILEVLRNAIDNHDIYIQYQPLFELQSNSIIGFEALMRIKSERLGRLSPIEFIPIAEESGLITELSSWLIREACLFSKNLIDLGATPRPVSVNISSVQINRPGFVSLLSEILNETQLPPEYLELEITESTLVSSIMDAAMLLSNLQNLGVRISLDDFGTGYSSLNYLTKLPINTLKIDKSFIDNICRNSKDAFIADSIIQLAHSLDIRVVAEGVEYEEQLALLKSHRCDIVQGYIYSAPLHPQEMSNLIREDDIITQYSIF